MLYQKNIEQKKVSHSLIKLLSEEGNQLKKQLVSSQKKKPVYLSIIHRGKWKIRSIYNYPNNHFSGVIA